MELVTGVTQVIKILGCSSSTIHRLIRSGEFPTPESVVLLGSGVKLRTWKREDIESFRSQLRGPGNPWKKRVNFA